MNQSSALWLLALCLLLACSSAPQPAPAMAPADPQIAALQGSMTELLERLDVMNDRITRLEKSSEDRAASAPAQAHPKRAAEVPAATQPSAPAASVVPRAIAGAHIADTYRNAILLYGKNRYPEARAAFQQVFSADASGELADNALFWIGETYFAAGEYINAIRYYKRVSDEYGDQNKAPDAMYKLALTYEKTSDLAQARTILQELIARYPYSAPAASARLELNRIKY